MHGLLAPFPLILAIVLNRPDHVHENGTYLHIFRVICVTVWAGGTLPDPALYAVRTEELVVAIVALDGLSVLSDYLVADAAEDVVFDVLDVVNVDYAILLNLVISCHFVK